jgi:NAD(P)-dependent dehydrogenase (short-subunit alcohol dehydrogenase family)
MSAGNFPNGVPVPPIQSHALSVLVTGASRGIGLELVKQYSAAHRDNIVFAGVRHSTSTSPALHQLINSSYNIHLIELDVADADSIKRSAQSVLAVTDHIDVLFNNAGITNGPVPLMDITPEIMMSELATNAVGPLLVVQAYTPLLAASKCSPAKLINVSSALSSNKLAGVLGKSALFYAYGSSKAALNYMNSLFAINFPDVQFTVIHPGVVATNDAEAAFKAKAVTTEDCVKGIRHLVATTDLSHSGQFIDNITRQVIPF